MRSRSSLLLSLFVVALSVEAVLAARGWPWKAALFPLVIGIPVLCLAAAEFLLELAGPRARQPGRGVGFESAGEPRPSGAVAPTLRVWSWILGFFGGILLLGFPVTIPLFVFLYLKLQGKEGWTLSIALAVMAWGFFYALFIHLLHLPFPAGWIQTWVGIQ